MFAAQDNVAERLKTFKMRKNIQTESVTTTSEAQHNSITPKNSKYNSTSSSSSAPSSRPTSHHRRRSSVSTRRESAEMMGVSTATLAELPSADDGDTNNIRRRALWALEGKRDDLPPTNYVGSFSKVEIPELSPNLERNTDSDRKSSIYFTNGSIGKRDSLGRERDSYGRVISQALSLKDQLHTLLEEDEEEENLNEANMGSVHSPSTSSCTSSSFSHSVSAPSSLGRCRLKPLTLSRSSPLTISVPASKTPSHSSLSELAAKRRSSLSYHRSDDVTSTVPSNPVQTFRHALPTPESTPTTSERPLSPSEQSFLFNNQASLLARISELERVLASRSRPMSFVSTSSRQLSTSSVASEPQSEELLRLIQDLKTERDEFSRELGVSHSKVENLENQISLLNRRIETERKEAWMAKQNEQALKIENSKLAKELDCARLQILRLKEDLTNAHDEINSHSVFRVHHKADSLPRSIERNEFPGADGDEENDLAHYEDEVDDMSFYSDGSASSTSLNELQRSVMPAVFGRPAHSPSPVVPPCPSIIPITAPVAAHKRMSSLEKGWSFPKGVQPTAKITAPKVDRFFDCLEILDEDLSQSPFDSNMINQDKYGFFSGHQDDDDDYDLPFVLPSQSTVTDNPDSKVLKSNLLGAKQTLQLTPPLSPMTPTVVMASHFDNKSAKKQVAVVPSTPQRVSFQVSKHTVPSLIPKPSPTRSDVSVNQLATPTSVPRVKISPVTPPCAVKCRDQREYLKSPTKLPQLRTASNSTHSSKLFTLDFSVQRRQQ